MVIRTAVKSEWSIDNILLGAGFKGTVLIIKFKNIHKHCIFHSNCSNRFYPEFSDFLFSRFVPPGNLSIGFSGTSNSGACLTEIFIFG